MFENLTNIITFYLPTVAALIGSIVSFLKLVKANKKDKEEIKDDVKQIKIKVDGDISQLRNALASSLKENAELKKQLATLYEQITGFKME